MLKKYYPVILVIIVLLSLLQGATAGDLNPATADQHHKIMIIPYEARMHLSDADLDIATWSEGTPQQIRAMIRNGFTQQLTSRLGDLYPTYSLMQDLRPEAKQEIDRIHHAIDYSFDTTYAILHPRPDSTQLKSRWSESKARKKELEKRTLSGDVRYMNAKVLDPGLLDHLNRQYNADVFIFLTQVEIKTITRDCLDLESKTYERDIKIHYTVLNKEGKQLYGDVASVRYPSNSNDIGNIMEKNFPLLTSEIQKSVGKK